MNYIIASLFLLISICSLVFGEFHFPLGSQGSFGLMIQILITLFLIIVILDKLYILIIKLYKYLISYII